MKTIKSCTYLRKVVVLKLCMCLDPDIGLDIHDFGRFLISNKSTLSTLHIRMNYLSVDNHQHLFHQVYNSFECIESIELLEEPPISYDLHIIQSACNSLTSRFIWTLYLRNPLDLCQWFLTSPLISTCI